MMFLLIQSLALFSTCYGYIRSKCLVEENSVIIPYISNREGQFKSDFGQDSQYISSNLYISFKWKDGLHVLDLHRSVLSPHSASLEWSEDNVTVASQLHNTQSYQGTVLGDRGSLAALSVSDGVNGYVATNTYEFVIESLNDDFSRTGLHRLTSCRKTGEFNHLTKDKSRHKRDATSEKKYMEVLLAIDTSAVKFIGKTKIETYILTIMNIVNQIYKHDTLDSNIEIVTSNIIMMDSSDEKSIIVKNEARSTVDRFCQWVLRNPQYARGTKHDVAVMLTRNLIGPAGYAPITGMCNPARSCAVIRDEGFTSAFIIAHEIAHVLGVYHSGHGNECYGRQYQHSMMASMVQATLQHHWWSHCSNTRINQVLPYLTCLNNNPFIDTMKGVSDPRGKPFTMDEQCRYEFGEGHISCRSYTGDLCNALWCAERNNQRLCKTKRGRPLNGTPCASGNYWCMNGSCEYHGHHKALDGSWGEWGSWSSCSTNCGVGIKKRSRICDSPRPAYGGKSCTGDDREIYACTTKEDCTDYTDLRFLQCAVLNGIPIRGRSHTWLPYQKEKDSEQCKLNCVSNDTNRVMTFDEMPLEDGTPCTYDEPNNICVKGECWKVGCDGVRDSSVKLDSCGVCGGNGSDCKIVAGNYKRKFNYKKWPPPYERILVLPADSREIEIVEEQSTTHYLAIRDPAYGTYYLNGGRRKGRSRKMVINGAWFEYDGNWNRETLKSKGPLRRPLEIMIMPQNKYQQLIVNYEYNVGKDDFTYEKNKYEWVFDYWTECSVTCGEGTQHIVNKCMDKDLDVTVEDDKCRYVGNGTGKPVDCKRKKCATEGYVWAMQLTWTECSASCGGGIQNQKYTCQKQITETDYENVNPLLCDQTAEPNYTKPCNEQKCGSYKWESTDEWTECPITCGIKGVQFEIFNCTYITDDDERELAEWSFCDNSKKPNISRTCRLEPCYQEWYQWAFYDEWTPCTETCGYEGVQFPVFICEQIDTHGFTDIVHVNNCDEQLRPESLPKPCNQESCVYEWFEWKYKDWGECSVVCGDFGSQTREYYCARIYSNGTIQEEKVLMCDDLQSPVGKRDCSGPPCVYSTFRLSYSTEWEECTATCGDMGIQTQKSICQEVMPNGTIADVNIHMCDDLVAVGETRSCNRVPCVSYKWTAAPFWTNCTAKCGDDGIMYQMHYCDKVSGDGTTQFVRYDYCSDLPMPFVIKECNRQPCIQEWIAGRWSECSVSCGTGKQTRDITCADPTTIGDDYLCFGHKPKDAQPCKLEDCPVEDAACVDKRSYCSRVASRRRCKYRSFRNRCCNSCSNY